jgi:hypothetical protein
MTNDHISFHFSQIFINLCHHKELAVPAIQKRLNAEGEEVEGMNIPLSVGPPRTGKDKGGADCKIYDVIVNPQVTEDVIADATGRHRDFICQLAIQSVEQKYKLSLDKRYKLPKIRYLGEITPQLIQDRKSTPKIEEVPVSSGGAKRSPKSGSVSNPLPSIPSSTPQKPDDPLTYTLQWYYEGGEEREVDVSWCSEVGDGGEGERDKQRRKGDTTQSVLPGPAPYVEPLCIVDDGVIGLTFRCTIDINSAKDTKDFKIGLSAYRLQVTFLLFSLPILFLFLIYIKYLYYISYIIL